MALRVRRNRRQYVGKFKLRKPQWIDPFPQIPGTYPEKLLFAALVARRIYFIYQGDFPITDQVTSVMMQDRNFKPDFIVPEWKIIYDPFGDYHHSLIEAVGTIDKPGSDVIKQVYYESKGYEFIHPWSSQVEKFGGDWMIDLSERIRHPPSFPLSDEDKRFKALQGYRLGPNVGLGSRSVAIANRRRARPKSRRLDRGRR